MFVRTGRSENERTWKASRGGGLLSLTIPTHPRKRRKKWRGCCFAKLFHTKPELAPLWGLQLSIGTSHLFLFLRNPKTAAYLILSLSEIIASLISVAASDEQEQSESEEGGGKRSSCDLLPLCKDGHLLQSASHFAFPS